MDSRNSSFPETAFINWFYLPTLPIQVYVEAEKTEWIVSGSNDYYLGSDIVIIEVDVLTLRVAVPPNTEFLLHGKFSSLLHVSQSPCFEVNKLMRSPKLSIQVAIIDLRNCV